MSRITVRNITPQKVTISRTAQQQIGLEQMYRITINGCEDYDGSYDVTPKVTAQIMETANKRMIDDVDIRAIPFYEVSNPQDGKTVYIGGNLND